MLKIRLQRFGRKHDPTFRVVLTDSRNSTKSGRFLEVLGSYDPRRAVATAFKKERVLHWLSKGVQPTPSIHNLLVRYGIVKGKKIHVAPDVKPAPAAQADSGAGGAPAAEAAPVSAPAPADAAQPAEAEAK